MNVTKLLSALALVASGMTITQQGSAGTGLIYETSVEWQTPSTGEYSHQQYTPLWHYKGSTYFVWTDATNRPWVTKTTNGATKTVPLDPNPDYKAVPDGHNRFSMGIDNLGFIHITGDMHNYTEGTTSPYVARYQKQSMLYWKSRTAQSIDDGFAFVGGRGAATTVPGTGWTYGRFFTDNFGELYYSSRVKAIEGSHAVGEMGLGLYRYNTTTSTWSALGGLADNIRVGKYRNVVLWELGGDGGWYQGFIARFRFDSANRLHLAAAINTDTNLRGNNRLIYAMSPDGGKTWKKASGASIPGLPIRARDGLANLGDVVADGGTTVTYGSEVGQVADKDGRPGVVVDNVWRTWDGTKWTTSNAQNPSNYAHGNDGIVGPGGALILPQTGSAKLTRTLSFQQLADGHDILGFNGYVAPSEYGLRTTGVVYGIGLNTTSKTQSIIKTSITPAPLPCAWTNKDIVGTPLGYAGVAGYAKGKFVVTNYGTEINNTKDTFHYTYERLLGDGAITARVTSKAAGGGARAGVMMRETLEPSSKHAAMLIAPNSSGAVFTTRTANAGQSSSVGQAGIPVPYWVRLIRQGTTFTGYISSDGITWTQTGKASIPMGESIYVGLAAASYNKNNMQTATFDNVSAPAPALAGACESVRGSKIKYSRLRAPMPQP